MNQVLRLYLSRLHGFDTIEHDGLLGIFVPIDINGIKHTKSDVVMDVNLFESSALINSYTHYGKVKLDMRRVDARDRKNLPIIANLRRMYESEEKPFLDYKKRTAARREFFNNQNKHKSISDLLDE